MLRSIVALGALVGLAGTPAAAEERPDFVFLMLDDLDELVTAPYLREVMPFTMGLVDRGVRFEDASSAVICCEARAAILTGLHAHNNGVYTNGGEYGGYAAFRAPLDRAGARLTDMSGRMLDNEDRTVAKLLAEAGYRTALIGKYMNGFEAKDGTPPPVPKGWTDGAAFVDKATSYTGYGYRLMSWAPGAAGEVHAYGHAEVDYATDVLSGEAVRFVERVSAAGDAPLFLYLTPTAPHLPLGPAPRHETLSRRWRGTLPTDRPSYFADGQSWDDKPQWLQSSIDARDRPGMRAFNQLDWHRRLGSLYAVDDMVKALWRSLEVAGRADRTVLVLTSDNGYNLGAHGLIHKMAPYQESLRVPLYFAGGAKTKLARGLVRDELVLHVDYAPTLLELAGLPIPAQMDGRSLAPLVTSRQPAQAWRRDFVQEYVGGSAANGIGAELPDTLEYELMVHRLPVFFRDIPTHRSLEIRLTTDSGATRRLSYIEWPVEGERELYDLDSDPHQLDNRLHGRDAACQPLIGALQRRLHEQLACTGAACTVERPLGVADVAMTRCLR